MAILFLSNSENAHSLVWFCKTALSSYLLYPARSVFWALVDHNSFNPVSSVLVAITQWAFLSFSQPGSPQLSSNCPLGYGHLGISAVQYSWILRRTLECTANTQYFRVQSTKFEYCTVLCGGAVYHCSEPDRSTLIKTSVQCRIALSYNILQPSTIQCSTAVYSMSNCNDITALCLKVVRGKANFISSIV